MNSSSRKNQNPLSVRLACVRRAASVRPEPGSNSLLKSKKAKTWLWIALKADVTFLKQQKNYRFNKLTRAVNCLSYCLIFKVQTKPRGQSFPRRHISLPHYFLFVNNFFKKFLLQFVRWGNAAKCAQKSRCHIIVQNFLELVKRILKNILIHTKSIKTQFVDWIGLYLSPQLPLLKKSDSLIKNPINYTILNCV